MDRQEVVLMVSLGIMDNHRVIQQDNGNVLVPMEDEPLLLVRHSMVHVVFRMVHAVHRHLYVQT